MQNLNKSSYKKVEKIFRKFSDNLAIKSIIDNNTRGQIYVDNIQKPETALIWNEITELFISGRISDEVVEKLSILINEKLIPAAKEGYIPGFNIYYPSNTWRNKINIIFDNYEIKDIDRQFYEFDKLKYKWKEEISNNLYLKKMNCSAIEQNYNNLKNMKGWINSFWKNCRDFEEKGIGYFLLKNNQIVSWSFSVYVKDRDYELAVATIKEHQKKGYAKLVVARTVLDCIEKNLNPQWHCDSKNIPSLKVAKDIGFKKVKDYKIAGIEF